MSLSNPTTQARNPATRWFEWDGANGAVRYYDKATKKEVVVPDKFRFIWLDQLATVKGWHDPSESAIVSNEVRDWRQEVIVVRAFKGGRIAEGHYANIKDRVGADGGHFCASIYLAYKDGDLKLGNFGLKGAALNAWVEFLNANRSSISPGTKEELANLKSVIITGFKEGKKGKVVFRTPVFALGPISPETIAQCVVLDTTLQTYLKSYFANTKVDQVQSTSAAVPHEEQVPADVSDAVADGYVDGDAPANDEGQPF